MSAAPAAQALLLVAIVAGTFSDRSHENQPLTIAGYRVLAADFHVHSALLNDGALPPWDLVLEAKRQGLDALAITPHGQLFDARLGRWFSRLVGGPTVLVGEEIVTPDYHLIAVGIQDAIGWRQPAAETIEEVHRQGGVAIAAHPGRIFWAGFDEAAMRRLDGAEVCHPMIHVLPEGQRMLEQFLAKAPMAPAVSKKGELAEAAAKAKSVREFVMNVRKHVEENAEYVGERFPNEARAIHYGDAEERQIYGEATIADARDLIEEGIPVAPLPSLPRADS